MQKIGLKDMTAYRVMTRREYDEKTVQHFMREFSDRAEAEEFADFMMDSYLSSPKDYDYEIEIVEVVRTQKFSAVKK